MLPGKTYSPADYLAIARRYVWLLVVPPLVGLFGALVYSAGLPNLYQSEMLIAVVPQRVPDEFVRSTVTLEIGERLNAISVQIMTRTFLEPLITELDLYPGMRRQVPLEDVVQRMRGAIEVQLENARSSRGPTAFRLRFSYGDPQMAARVTQRLGSIFVDQSTRDRGALAEATDAFLESQLDGARQQLEATEQRLEAFRERHGNELPTQQGSNMQAIQHAQLQLQALVERMARDRDRKFMLERLYQQAAAEPPPAVPPPGLPTQAGTAATAVQQGTAGQQLAAARAQLAGLERRLTPEHPDITRMKRLIAELEPKATAEAAAQAAADSELQSVGLGAAPTSPQDAERRARLLEMRAEIESIDRRTEFNEAEEQRLHALVDDYQRRVEAVPGLESEWVALTRDYDTQQAAYRGLLTKSQAARLSVELEDRQIGENFRILDPAAVPVAPISPDRRRIHLTGLAAGLLLGLGFVALLEFRDGSYRSEADVFEVLALPVLASLPIVETVTERARRVRWLALQAAAVLFAVGGAGYVCWTMRLWTVLS